MRVGLFNVRSVCNKSASIQHQIIGDKIGIAALTDASRPDLIAYAPVGYEFAVRTDAPSLHTADIPLVASDECGSIR